MYPRPKKGLLMLSMYALIPIVFFWAAVILSVFYDFNSMLLLLMGTSGNDMLRSVLIGFVCPVLAILFASLFLLRSKPLYPQYKNAGIAVIITAFISLFAVSGYIISDNAKKAGTSIDNFSECEAAGYPIMESYPRQCRTPDGKSFTEVIQ